MAEWPPLVDFAALHGLIAAWPLTSGWMNERKQLVATVTSLEGVDGRPVPTVSGGLTAVLVNFGPPFALALAAMAVLALVFPSGVAGATLAGARGGALAEVAGMLGLFPPKSEMSLGRQVAVISEITASLPAILLAVTLAPAVAAMRFLVGLLFAWTLGRTLIPDHVAGAMDQETEAATNLWRRVTATVSRLLDRYLNSLILAAVVAGVIGFLVPDAFVAQVLGGNRLYAPIIAAVLAILTPAKGGADVIVAATLLAKGAGIPAVLALLLSAPLLNAWTFRQLTSSLSVQRAAVIWTTIAVPAILLGSAAALLPGLQRI